MVLAGVLLAAPAAARAQDGGGESTHDASERDALFDAVVEDITALEAAIPEAERARKLNQDPDAIAAVNAQLAAMRSQLRARRKDLSRLVSGFDPEFGEEAPSGTIRWEDEAQELLSPVLSGIKHATIRPRRIEKLRSRVLSYDDQLPRIRQAIDNATQAMDQATTDAARTEIAAVRGDWLDKQAKLESDRRLAQMELNHLQDADGGFADASRAFFELFFRSRGRNGLIALAVFLGVFLFVKLSHRVLIEALPMSEARRNSMGVRLLELGVYVVGSASALGAALVVLYASGDWVLLTVAVILLVGLVWGARAALPRFWREAQLLLNVGPVRQGERLVWQGVPWRVSSLHVVTILENPAFPRVHLRLPLAALTDVSSRPPGPNEPWFPSEVGDVVLWEGRAARVLDQGPEFVTLEREGSRLTLPTPAFLEAGIVNLSHGFRHRVTVTLDYRHQDIATTSAPLRLRAHVAAALAADPAAEHLRGLACEFDSANASSLDLEIEADFDGAAAGRWEPLAEVIAAAAVDACNAEGWEIALPQLTLHQAPTKPVAAPRPAQHPDPRA